MSIPDITRVACWGPATSLELDPDRSPAGIPDAMTCRYQGRTPDGRPWSVEVTTLTDSPVADDAGHTVIDITWADDALTADERAAIITELGRRGDLGGPTR